MLQGWNTIYYTYNPYFDFLEYMEHHEMTESPQAVWEAIEKMLPPTARMQDLEIHLARSMPHIRIKAVIPL